MIIIIYIIYNHIISDTYYSRVPCGIEPDECVLKWGFALSLASEGQH